MNPRGQVFSVDFVISLAVVMLAFGMILQVNELQFYEANEAQRFARLERMGQAASDVLVQHPDIMCPITEDGVVAEYLPNTWCLPRAEAAMKDVLTPITQEDLGIPESFGCHLRLVPDVHDFNTSTLMDPTVEFCTDPIPAEEDRDFMFTVQRSIVVSNTGTISSYELQDCREGEPGCILSRETVTLYVWREPS